MLSRRLGAVAFGAGAAIVVAACSHSYAEDAPPVGAVPEAGVADSSVTIDADVVADGVAPPDASPTYVELAKGLDDLTGIAATETDVYVLERGTGIVRAISIGGGPLRDIEKGAGSTLGIAVVGGSLFWGDFGGAAMKKKGIAGGATSVVTTGAKGPFAVAATNDGVAVLTLGAGEVGELQQYDLDLVARPTVGPLANPFGVAFFGDALYWTESGSGRIGQSRGSLINDEVASGETDCQSIAANATGVYWTRLSAGLVRVKALASSGVTSLATGEVGPHSIAVSDADVYWLTTDGRLRRKRVGQELPPANLATGFPSAFSQMRTRALALTSNYVVWITTDGRVLRTAK